ncbi:hypothetical protein RB653_004992 [Dictyostelium firmibasis]|uniref:KHA domain-containing protein n=1 Tax=Dictyostelium firmibasis TaxID=79012 RepID=A0AAN7YSN9_9MYCE
MLSSMTDIRKRVTVFQNGKRVGGKAISLPKKWSEFLKIVSKKLNIPASRIYNEDGGEIDEIESIVAKEILYASCGEHFIHIPKDIGFFNQPTIPNPYIIGPQQQQQQPPNIINFPFHNGPIVGGYPQLLGGDVIQSPSSSTNSTTTTTTTTSSSSCSSTPNVLLATTTSPLVATNNPNNIVPLIGGLVNHGCITGLSSCGAIINNSEWISLNVGGRIFSTTRSTIIRDKDSMLAKMFSENWDSAKDINGAYLIDRSPDYFTPILNYLRCGTIIIDESINVEGVYQEARFFNITGMLDKLASLVERKARSTDVFTRKDVISILLTSSSNSSLRCQGLNLAGVDLSKLDLRNINFKMTNFKETNLSKCNLDNALLQEADLSGANLTGASLRGSNLTGANLEDCILKGANFEDRGGQRATLENVNFKNASLEEANFSGANLRVCNFKSANLENCNFRGADLAGANLEDCNLRGANLHKANLIGVNLKGANFDIRTVSSR